MNESVSDPIIYARISLIGVPDWRWFVTECAIDGGRYEILFFGYVCGFTNEWGYFNLSELEKMRTTLLINKKFFPAPFSEVKKEYKL